MSGKKCLLVLLKVAYDSQIDSFKFYYLVTLFDAKIFSPALALDHETDHAVRAALDLLLFINDRNTFDFFYTKSDEKKSVKAVNKTSKKLNNGDGGYGGRTTYGGPAQRSSYTNSAVDYHLVLQNLGSSSKSSSGDSKKKKRQMQCPVFY